MSSRRSFILSLCSVMMLPLEVRQSRRRAPLSQNRRVDKIDVSTLNVQIPWLIFFPECVPRKGNRQSHCKEKNVTVTALRLEARTVVVDFSNGLHRQFPAAMSFVSGGKKSLLDRVAIKRLASWLLAGLQQAGGGLQRRDFELLQQQQVLETVTPGALYNLLKVTGIKPVAAGLVTWEPKQMRFVVK